MPTRRALSVALAALASCLAAAVASEPVVESGEAASRLGGDLLPGATPAELEAVRGDLLARVNEARNRAGREALERNAALELAASRHAADMLGRGYFAHESPEGSTATARAEAAGYPRARVLGETIAYGQRTAAEVVAGWLESPPHRRILLDGRATESGIGVAVDATDRGTKVTWVQLVAAPATPP